MGFDAEAALRSKEDDDILVIVIVKCISNQLLGLPGVGEEELKKGKLAALVIPTVHREVQEFSFSFRPEYHVEKVDYIFVLF